VCRCVRFWVVGTLSNKRKAAALLMWVKDDKVFIKEAVKNATAKECDAAMLTNMATMLVPGLKIKYANNVVGRRGFPFKADGQKGRRTPAVQVQVNTDMGDQIVMTALTVRCVLWWYNLLIPSRHSHLAALSDKTLAKLNVKATASEDAGTSAAGGGDTENGDE
jgi:hypothetical protein